MIWSLSVFIFAGFLLDVQSYSGKPCYIANIHRTKGHCTPIDHCRQTFANLVALQFEPNFSYEKYLHERMCGRDRSGGIHICCADESRDGIQTVSPMRKAQSRQSCRTFRNGQGTCVPIESCPSIYNCSVTLQRTYNPTLHLHLTQSFCYRQQNKVYVCCDDGEQAPVHFSKKLGWQDCQTPFMDEGKCVPPSRCGLIRDSDHVPEVFQAFMVGCDESKHVDHMCCPSKEIQYDVKFGRECSTMAGKSGFCVESERCGDFVEASDGEEYVRKNWCYTDLDQVDYVCCPKVKVLKNPEKTFGVGSRLGEDAPTCTTPNSTPGRCLPLADCAPIVTILRQVGATRRAITPTEATFLRNSVCSPGTTTSAAYYVCCDETSLRSDAPTTETTTTTAAPPPPPSEDIANHPNARLLDATSCGRANLDDKIAFGERAQMYQYPWMAMLIYRAASGQEGPECGGTVINNRYILTAAHCIVGQIERLLYIRLGEFDTRTDPDCDEYMDCAPPYRRYTVEQSLTHPNFTRVVRSGNDIGLLRVDRNIEFSADEVIPICLPTTNRLVDFDPSLFWITGWGLTERLETSPILLQTRIPSVDCSLKTHSICAGFGNGTLHCRGDSGGPMKVQVPELSFRYVQYGIISAGPGCGVSGTPGVSTRVSFFMSWILDNIRA